MPPTQRADPGATGPPGGGLLTVDAAAAELGVTGPHVRVLIGDGELRAIDIARRGAKRPRWRIDPDEVLRFCERRTSEPPAPRPPRPRQPAPAVKEFF
ncbi:helix-turn-helix domain-containing protein [Alienimonas sp. DA493]|uniref:helix-turn-helix domain-containing protein n=1 Tax=Alienimonas sp. DA493 TaxID=3373605 RepID=UPI003754DA3F